MIGVPYVWWFTFPHEQAAYGCVLDLAGEPVEARVVYLGEGEWMLEAGGDTFLPRDERDPLRFDALAHEHGALAYGGKWFDLAGDDFVVETAT